MNYALILGTAAVFLFQVSLGRSVDALVRAYGFTPASFAQALEDGDPALLMHEVMTIFTSLFLHGGWFHVIGNLLYLRVFGDNVEDRFGHLPYLLFYLASGAAGTLAHFLVDPGAPAPLVGASGAIAGVLGAYIVLFPAARIVTLFPIFIFLTFIEVPAVLFLGIWAVTQLLNGYMSLGGSGEGSGVAWFAHIGGFALGIVCGLLWKLLGRRPRRTSRVF